MIHDKIIHFGVDGQLACMTDNCVFLAAFGRHVILFVLGIMNKQIDIMANVHPLTIASLRLFRWIKLIVSNMRNGCAVILNTHRPGS